MPGELVDRGRGRPASPSTGGAPVEPVDRGRGDRVSSPVDPPPSFRNSPVSNSLDVVDFFVALAKADQDTKLGFEHKEVVNSNTTSFRALKIED